MHQYKWENFSIVKLDLKIHEITVNDFFSGSPGIYDDITGFNFPVLDGAIVIFMFLVGGLDFLIGIGETGDDTIGVVTTVAFGIVTLRFGLDNNDFVFIIGGNIGTDVICPVAGSYLKKKTDYSSLNSKQIYIGTYQIH